MTHAVHLMTPANRRGKVGKPESSGLAKEMVNAAQTKMFGFRIKHDLRDKLELITEFEQALNPTELVRSWVVEKVSTYNSSKRFREFVAAKG